MMRIVAEMMIFANAAVGERVYRAFPRAALLRRHPPPRRESFAEVGVGWGWGGGQGPVGHAMGRWARPGAVLLICTRLHFAWVWAASRAVHYRHAWNSLHLLPPHAQVLPLCESVGVTLDFSTNAALSTSLAAASAAAPPAVATLIKSLTTRAMSEAEYFCTGEQRCMLSCCSYLCCQRRSLDC